MRGQAKGGQAIVFLRCTQGGGGANMPSKALKVPVIKGVLPLAGGTQIEALKIELKKGFADVAWGEPDFSTRVTN